MATVYGKHVRLGNRSLSVFDLRTSRSIEAGWYNKFMGVTAIKGPVTFNFNVTDRGYG